jgi:hypothetical protein
MAWVSTLTHIEIPDHHGSHRDLLWAPSVDSSPAGRGVDAIVVPTFRRPAYLAGAADLARELDCFLITLHSGPWTTAAKAADRLSADVNLIAIDIPEPAQLNLPPWQTSRLLAGTVFAASRACERAGRSPRWPARCAVARTGPRRRQPLRTASRPWACAAPSCRCSSVTSCTGPPSGRASAFSSSPCLMRRRSCPVGGRPMRPADAPETRSLPGAG